MPVNCLSGLAAYPFGCREAASVQDVWVRGYSASTTWTYDANDIITGGTNTSATFYNLPQRLETCEFKPGAPKPSAENGTIYYEQTLNLTLHKYQASLRNLVFTLGKGEVEFIVLSQSGKYFIVGEENGALLTDGGDISVGKALGDLNGATLPFISKATSPARELSAAFFATLTTSS